MKVTVLAVPIQLGRFTVRVRDPGIVRLVAFKLERKLIALRGDSDMEEKLVAFVETTSDGEPRAREFVAFIDGAHFVPDEGERAEWRGTGIGPKHTVHLFEVLEAL